MPRAERPGGAGRAALVVAGVVLLVPLVVLAVRVVIENGPSPAGDVGLIEVRVRDVGLGGHLPLLGSYSRFGFGQPGPLLLYVLALPYRLLGGRFSGLQVGALLLNGAAVVAVLAVAHRRAGRVGVAGTGAILAVLIHGFGPGWLTDPWEPHVLVAPGLALLVLAFDAVAGRSWSLPVVGAIASLLAEASGSLLPFAVAMAAWATVAVVVRARRQPAARRALAVTAVVVVVLWLPPLVQQVTHHPGNLTRMADTLGGPEPKLGLADGWRTVALELSHRATWLGVDQRLVGLTGAVDLGVAPAIPVGAVALVLATIAAAVRRRTTVLLLALTTLVAIAASTFAMSRLIGPVFAWIPQWLRLLGPATWLAVGAVAVDAMPVGARARLARAAVPLLAAVAAVATIASTVDAIGDWREADPLRDAVLRLAAAGASATRDADGPVLVRSRVDAAQLFGGDDVAPEVLVLGLEKRGVPTVVDRALANKFGPERAHPERADLELRMVAVPDDVDDVENAGPPPPPPGFTVVATADPMGATGRARRRRILAAAGLAPTATDAEVTRAIAADPSLRPRLLALRDLPARPRLALLRGPAGAIGPS